MGPASFARAVALPLLILATFAAACSDRDDTAGTPAAERTPTPSRSQTVTSPVPPTATATTAVTATAQAAGPAIEWMNMESAGAGAVVVHVATDVPTSLVLSIVRDAPDPLAPNATAISQSPSKLHTQSLASGATDFVVQAVVTDAQGRSSTGLLETGAIAGRQYWGRGEFAPKIALGGQLAVEVTWTNLRSSGEPNIPGKVALLQRPVGCTVAQQCENTFLRNIEGDQVGGDAAAETHKIAFTLPDGFHDYRVILIGKPGASSSVRQFYQFDLRSADLK